MQYILSEEEYLKLKYTQEYQLKLSKDKLQELCTKIANEMPVTLSWMKNDLDYVPEPWGCKLTSTRNFGYCDCCPVQDICPAPKSWSK